MAVERPNLSKWIILEGLVIMNWQDISFMIAVVLKIKCLRLRFLIFLPSFWQRIRIFFCWDLPGSHLTHRLLKNHKTWMGKILQATWLYLIGWEEFLVCSDSLRKQAIVIYICCIFYNLFDFWETSPFLHLSSTLVLFACMF